MRLIDQIRAGAKPEPHEEKYMDDQRRWLDTCRGDVTALYVDEIFDTLPPRSADLHGMEGVRCPFHTLWMEGKASWSGFDQLGVMWVDVLFKQEPGVIQTLLADAQYGVNAGNWRSATTLSMVRAYVGGTRRTGWCEDLGTGLVGTDDDGVVVECVVASEDTKSIDNSLEVAMISVYLPCFALSVLNCRNVRMVQPAETEDSRKLSRAHERRHGAPIVRYYVLDVDPSKPRRDSSTGDGNGPTVPLHICRGHFKTYTAERPLLGKLTGRYWWHAHARGDGTIGTILKDYRVVAPRGR